MLWEPWALVRSGAGASTDRSRPAPLIPRTARVQRTGAPGRLSRCAGASYTRCSQSQLGERFRRPVAGALRPRREAATARLQRQLSLREPEWRDRQAMLVQSQQPRSGARPPTSPQTLWNSSGAAPSCRGKPMIGRTAAAVDAGQASGRRGNFGRRGDWASAFE